MCYTGSTEQVATGYPETLEMTMTDMTLTIREDVDLDDLRAYTLRKVTDATRRLRKLYFEMARVSQAAVIDMAEGRVPSSGITHHGAIGHQLPADITAVTAELDALLGAAAGLRCTDDEIKAAYQAGAKANA